MALGFTLIVTTLMAVVTALTLVFDARWRDFPFAALTMAVVPLWMLTLLNPSKIRRAADRRNPVCRPARRCRDLYRLQ